MSSLLGVSTGLGLGFGLSGKDKCKILIIKKRIVNKYFDLIFCLVNQTYGSECSKTEECVSGIGLNCVSEICTCIENYYYNGLACGDLFLSPFLFICS